jgi:CRP/FNR family transcriptional regulator
VFCPLAPLYQQLHTLAPLNRYPRQKIIFLEGQLVTELMIVCGGRLRLFRDTPEGKEVITGWLSPGDVIGYTGLFAQVPFDVSCQVEEACALRRVPLSVLRRLAHQDAGLYERLLAYICREHYELRQAHGEVLSKCPPRVRLARLLLSLGSSKPEPSDGHLQLSVEKLASKLGLSRQTVSGLLAEFRREGIIRGRGARISILDREALKKWAGLGELPIRPSNDINLVGFSSTLLSPLPGLNPWGIALPRADVLGYGRAPLPGLIG